MESIKNFEFEKMILRLTGWKNIVERLINSWMQVDVLRLTFLESQWCNRSNILIWNRIWFLILVFNFITKWSQSIFWIWIWNWNLDFDFEIQNIEKIFAKAFNDSWMLEWA